MTGARGWNLAITFALRLAGYCDGILRREVEGLPFSSAVWPAKSPFRDGFAWGIVCSPPKRVAASQWLSSIIFGLETPADCGIRRVEEQVSALRRRTLSQG